MTNMVDKLPVGLLTLVVIISVVGFVPVAGASNPASVPDGEVFNATNSVGIWQHGIFTVRPDFDYATSKVGTPNVRVNTTAGSGDTPLIFYDSVGVFDHNQSVTIEFKGSRTPDGFGASESNVQIVRAEVTGSGDGIPSTFSDALNLISADNANENASFTMIDESTSLNSGDHEFTDTPPNPGHYVYYYAVNESGSAGFEVVNGDEISLDGDVTIIGATGITVQKDQATVDSPSSVTRGDTVTFDVDASAAFGGQDTTHAIVLYKKDTVENSDHMIEIDESELDSGFDVEEDSTLYSSIGETTGVADVEDGIEINGVDVSDGRIARSAGIGTIVDLVAEDLNTGAPEVKRTDDTILYASTTAVSGEDSETEVKVDTFENFSTGEYQWVYVGQLDDDATQVSTNVGTLTIKASAPGGGPPADRGRNRDRGRVDTPGTTVTTNGRANVEVTDTDRGTSIQIDVQTPGTSVQIQRTTGQITSQLQRDGAALEGMDVEFREQTNFDMEISNTPDKPDPSIPDPPSDRGAVGYINVAHSASDDSVGEVRFNFRVSQQRLDDAGLSTDEVVLYRYSGGEWTALETEYLGTAEDGTPRFRAISPGLSVFAIGGQQTQQETPTEGPTTTEEPPATDGPTTTAAPATPTTAPIEEPGGFSGLTIIAIVVLALVAIGGLYWYRQQ